MITVNKNQTPEGLQVDLIGAIEESVSFENLIGPFTGQLTVNCRGVTRINSVGVKTWVKYFQNLKALGRKFRFIECSTAIIEQLNMISNFASGGEVVSLLLPFSCLKCQREFVANCKTEDLKKNNLQIPNVKCEKPECGARFDDDPDEYLYFLKD